MPEPAALFGIILFGSIGFAAFIYGRKSRRPKPLVLDVGLKVFPYFVSQTWLLYTIGAVLCAGLFVFRD